MAQLGPFQQQMLEQGGEPETPEEFEKARKQQAAWIFSQSVVRLTKLCAPKCLTFQQVQVSRDETECIKTCVKALHGTHLETFRYFDAFEASQQKQESELAQSLAKEFQEQKRRAEEEATEKRRQESGFVKM